ncbi:lipid-A-disaccharide synthase [Sneathiella sp.]|uniref:lipid-A-disaccharide synthase n=1 Tax=Sneathiella sp. TaxID=1964365 RepID=UPI003561E887
MTPGDCKVFIVAGEPSGDALGAKLMGALRQQSERSINFEGVGGPLMAAEGLDSLFPMDDLTVMGLFEVVPKLRLLFRRMAETATAAKEFAPDVFITIDAPDFSFRVAKKLQGTAFPKVHYVAPSVWAWRPGRAQKIAPLYDHLLTLLPFEPPYFEKVGLSATFVGHSVVESGAGEGDGIRFRQEQGIGPEERVLMMLAGSRRSEVERLLPIFKTAAENLRARIGEFRLVAPVVGRSGEIVRDAVKSWKIPVLVLEGEAAKYDAMAAADVALAASGTVGLELALARLPTVIAYKLNAITARIARRFVKLDFVNLVNILLAREIVPEYILENCTAANLTPALAELFHCEEKRARQIAGFDQAMLLLGKGDISPGERAAKVVLHLIAQKENI